MANYRMVRQDVDDYDKVMGEYVVDYNQAVDGYTKSYDQYVSKVNEYNSLPYISYVGGAQAAGGFYEWNEIGLSDGRTFRSHAQNAYPNAPGARVYVAPGAQQYQQYGGQVSLASVPNAPAEPTYPDKPAGLNLTRAEEKVLSDPPQSLAQAAAGSPSTMEKLKKSADITGSAYRGGLDSSAGILQKVMKGQL